MVHIRELSCSENNNGVITVNSKRNLCSLSIEKIRNFPLKPGYNFVLDNGQRIYQPLSELNIPPPPRNSEVFIGKLFKHIYEDELIPLFERIAPIYKFRMMLEFNQKSRGFAFATYFTPEDAEKAALILNNYPLRNNLRIAVYESVDNCRLFLGNIPKHVPASEIMLKVSEFVEGVKDVIVYEDYFNGNLHRGFAFVEFETHRFAAVARRQFSPQNLVAWGRNIRVDWANPVPRVPKMIMEKVTVLYISNIPLKYNTTHLLNYIGVLFPLQYIRRAFKTDNYAFLHLVNRKCAEYALEVLNGVIIDDKEIKVEWARPRKYRSTPVEAPTNLCRSVPLPKRKLVDKKLAQLVTTQHKKVPFRKRTIALPSNVELARTNQYEVVVPIFYSTNAENYIMIFN